MNVLIDVFSYKLSFLTDLLRYLFLFLDGLIYNLIQPLYAAALNLADIREVLHQDQLVELITSRIYIFLGLFMFFKLAFSIISMIANPDMVNDKQKGLSKIVTNVIITLILLVIMPSVFRMAYGLQDTVINGGYLRGIFGTTHDGKMATGNEGVELGKKVFRIFINPINDNGTTQNAINLFEEPTDRVDVGVLNTNDAMTRDTKGIYDISYMMVISTIVGVMMVISFLKIGVEIALRSLKLLVLEIISPIAVISYLDPASASKGLFAKWSSLAIKTYLSLFLRLGMVYFITSMLSGINIEDFGNGLGTLPSIILILALLAFMQSAPKMLEELFGYKPGEDSKAIKGIVNGALGFGVGAAYRGIQDARAASSQQTGFRKITSGLKGAAKGAAKGGISGASAGHGKGLGAAYAATKKGFQGTEDYKALMQAKGKNKAIGQGRDYENATPKWFGTGNEAQEEAEFLAAADAATAANYTAITGYNAAAMKTAFRKNEAEKAANNATFSPKYAAAKNAAGDTGFAKKSAANKVRGIELDSKRAEDLKNSSAARRSQLEASLNSANATHSRIISERDTQIRIMGDMTLSAEQRSVASAKKASLDNDLIDINTNITTINGDLTTAITDEATYDAAWKTSISDLASAQSGLEIATAKDDKNKKLLESMQKEPEYSRDAKIDSGISRSAIL